MTYATGLKCLHYNITSAELEAHINAVQEALNGLVSATQNSQFLRHEKKNHEPFLGMISIGSVKYIQHI